MSAPRRKSTTTIGVGSSQQDPIQLLDSSEDEASPPTPQRPRPTPTSGVRCARKSVPAAVIEISDDEIPWRPTPAPRRSSKAQDESGSVVGRVTSSPSVSSRLNQSQAGPGPSTAAYRNTNSPPKVARPSSQLSSKPSKPPHATTLNDLEEAPATAPAAHAAPGAWGNPLPIGPARARTPLIISSSTSTNKGDITPATPVRTKHEPPRSPMGAPSGSWANPTDRSSQVDQAGHQPSPRSLSGKPFDSIPAIQDDVEEMSMPDQGSSGKRGGFSREGAAKAAARKRWDQYKGIREGSSSDHAESVSVADAESGRRQGSSGKKGGFSMEGAAEAAARKRWDKYKGDREGSSSSHAESPPNVEVMPSTNKPPLVSKRSPTTSKPIHQSPRVDSTPNDQSTEPLFLPASTPTESIRGGSVLPTAQSSLVLSPPPSPTRPSTSSTTAALPGTWGNFASFGPSASQATPVKKGELTSVSAGHDTQEGTWGHPRTVVPPRRSSPPPPPKPTGSWGDPIQIAPSQTSKRPPPQSSSTGQDHENRRKRSRQDLSTPSATINEGDHIADDGHNADTDDMPSALIDDGLANKPVTQPKKGPRWVTESRVPTSKPQLSVPQTAPPTSKGITKPVQPAARRSPFDETGQLDLGSGHGVVPMDDSAIMDTATDLGKPNDNDLDDFDNIDEGATIAAAPMTENMQVDASASHILTQDHSAIDVDADPLALTDDVPVEQAMSPLAPTNPTSALNKQVEDVRSQVEDISVFGVSPRASPAPSTAPSIQEIDKADIKPVFASASPVPAFKPTRPPGMDNLTYLKYRVKQKNPGPRNSSSPVTPSTPNQPTPPLAKPALSPPAQIAEETMPAQLEQPGRENAIAGPSRSNSSDEAKMSRGEWLRIVDEDGASDVEILLDGDGTDYDPSSGHSPIDLWQSDRHHDPTQSPPNDRRGVVKRHFDSAAIDDWNDRLPKLTKNPALHRMIFESYIQQKELESGPIGVVNNVDSEGAPPDMEFEYSNEMLYNKDVPDPEKGLGCGCVGPCDPESKTCTCLKRQQLYFYDLDYSGFAYDEEGHAKNGSIPIWECSDTCGCPPECMNRVIQRGRKHETKLEIVKTRKKGWGVQAKSAIKRGTFIGIYAGEVITEIESEYRGELYTEIGRTYLFDLDGWQIRNPPAGLRSIDPRLADIAEASAARAKQAIFEVQADPNFVYNAYSVDAFHYGYTRFFNHSCDPNLEITQCYVKDFHPERPLLVIFARRDISAKEELCISYKGITDEAADAEEQQVERKCGKKGKKRQSKTSAAAHVSTKNKKSNDKLDKNRCFCDAPNCDGKMFSNV